MGIVYRARDTKLNREVALKVLSPELITDSDHKRRFLQEARAAAGLKHPNIAVIYEVDEDDGVTFIAMELIDGRPLEELIGESRLPLDQYLELAIGITDALACAHERGIVHRDLKPANVMVTEDGRPKIIDFGLAKLVPVIESSGSEHPTAVKGETRPGDVMGTVPYMSPEQARGRAVDHRSDIFSLGTILYEMATGRHPFEGETAADVLSSILRDDPPPAGEIEPGIARELEGILSRCLEKEPDRRYQRAEELKKDLSALAGEGAESFSSLERGRAAFEAEAWQEAYDRLTEADRSGKLDARDVERLAEAAWWLGKSDECTRARERAYSAYLKEGNEGRAALVAILLAEDFFHKLAKSVGNGWLKRAERLLEGLPESVEHGYWSRMQARLAVESGEDLDRVLALTDRVMEIADRFGDVDLQALALQDRGSILVSRGEVSEGMELIDEAMATAMSGEIGPRTLGRIYCNMMNACEKLADFRRASEWSEVASRWCEPHSDSGYHGICRVRKAELLRLRGAWKDAEEHAREACAELKEFLSDVSGEAYYEIGEIRLRMGDFAEAEKAFRHAHELGREPVPGLARLRLAQGRLEDAKSLMERALAEGSQVALDRVRLLPTQIEVLIHEGKLEEAEAATTEMEAVAEQYATQALRAHGAYARGSLQLASRGFEEAVLTLRRALKLYNEVDLPYEAARTRMLLASAYRSLGSTDNAELELQAASSAFAELGAAADLRAASRLMDA